jgi:hypothetical protein
MIVITRSAEFTDRLREFRDERLGVIREGKVPGELEKGARIVAHVVPAKAFNAGDEMDFSSFRREMDYLRPMYAGSYGPVRHNFDGMLNVAGDGDTVRSYVHLFRSGIVEAVNTSLLTPDLPDRRPLIPCPLYEKEVIELVLRTGQLLKDLGVDAPLYVMLSLLGVEGYMMYREGSMRFGYGHPVDRDDLLVPEVRIESHDGNLRLALRPAFYRVANACGWPRSYSYDDQGNWTAK